MVLDRSDGGVGSADMIGKCLIMVTEERSFMIDRGDDGSRRRGGEKGMWSGFVQVMSHVVEGEESPLWLSSSPILKSMTHHDAWREFHDEHEGI